MFAAAVVIAFIVAPIIFLVGMIRPKIVLPYAKASTRTKAAGLAIVIFFAAAITAAGLAPPAADRSVNEASAEHGASAAPARALPKSESDYIDIFVTARKAYAHADNELKKSTVLIEMMKTLSADLNHMATAVDWEGRISAMGTNGDGNAWVEIEIADDMTITTWNNAISDFSDHTLIANGSPLYRILAEMSKGDRVRFSARFIRLSDLTEAGKVNEPAMIAQFNAIAPVR